MRLILRSKDHYDDLVTKHSDLGNLMLDTAKLVQYSEVVLGELISAVRIFTRSIQACGQISVNKTNVLVSVAVNPPNQKLQQVALETIKNLMKILEHDRQLKQAGGHELLNALNS